MDADVSFSTPPVVGSGVTKTRVEGCTIVVVTAMVLSFFGGSLMHGPMMYDVRQNSEDFLSQFPGKEEREKKLVSTTQSVDLDPGEKICTNLLRV